MRTKLAAWSNLGAVGAVVLALLGCDFVLPAGKKGLKPREIVLRFDIMSDLSGVCTLTVKKVHIEKFYTGTGDTWDVVVPYKDDTGEGTESLDSALANLNDVLKQAGMALTSPTLQNTTETRTDIIIQGKFKDLKKALRLVNGNEKVEITSAPSGVSVIVPPKSASKEDKRSSGDIPGRAEVKCFGKILKTDAPAIEKPEGLMTWDLRVAEKKGMSFVFETGSVNKKQEE